MRSSARRRVPAGTVLLVSTSLLLTLVALEVAFRLAGVSVGTVQINRATVRRTDNPRLRFELRPGSAVRAEVPYRVNAEGLRGGGDERAPARRRAPRGRARRLDRLRLLGRGRGRLSPPARADAEPPGDDRARRGAELRGSRVQPRPGDRGAAHEGARVLARPRGRGLLPQRPRGPLLLRAGPRAGPPGKVPFLGRPPPGGAPRPLASALLDRVPLLRAPRPGVPPPGRATRSTAPSTPRR